MEHVRNQNGCIVFTGTPAQCRDFKVKYSNYRYIACTGHTSSCGWGGQH